MTDTNLSASSLMRYGFLAAPVAFAAFPLYVLAPDYYARTYDLSLTTLGIVLMFLRLLDAVQDPLIGFLSDRYRASIDLFLIVSATVLLFSIYGLFTLAYISPLIWFVLCVGLATTAYSVVTINLNALGALWTKDESAQTQIAAAREGFGLLGLVVAVSMPGVLSNIVPESQVYHWFGLVLLVLMVTAFGLFLSWYNTALKVKLTGNMGDKSRRFFSFYTFTVQTKRLLLVYLISMLASSIPAVLVIFYVRDLLGTENYTGLFLLLYFTSGAVMMPVWKRISQRYGKYSSWCFAMLLASGSFIWAFFLEEGDVWQYGIICIASGAALGADLIFPPAILADQLHSSKLEDRASTHYAILTLTAKASLALASAIALPVLESFGFTPQEQNSTKALFGLSFSYALVPCVLKISAALLLLQFFIHDNKANTTFKGNRREKNSHNTQLSGDHHRSDHHAH